MDISGAADVKSENQLTCDKLTLISNGAGDVHLDLKANEIKTDISGAGDVSLKGTTQLLDATVSGAGDLKASNLEATKIKAKVSGAGDAKVYAIQGLDADVSGAGSINVVLEIHHSIYTYFHSVPVFKCRIAGF